MRDDIKRVIRAEDIANDLIQCWTTNAPFMRADAKPAVWICGADGPAAAEIEENDANQGRYAENLVSHVDAIPEEQRAKQIRDWPLPKAMAKWARIERDWLDDTRPEQRIACPECRKPVDRGAMTCPHCRAVVDIKAYSMRQAELERAKRDAMKEVTKAALETASAK